MNTSIALVPFNEPRGPPFGQTTGDNPRLRFSARTLRATRLNARSARATKTGGFFAPLLRLFLFILRVIVGPEKAFNQFKSSFRQDAETSTLEACAPQILRLRVYTLERNFNTTDSRRLKQRVFRLL